MAANQGEVDIPYAGGVETLKCTLRAAKEVNAHFGDFSEAFRRVRNFDFAALVVVVAAGLGKKPEDVEQAVFNTGMDTLYQPVCEFVPLLSNGGRPPKPLNVEGDKPGEG